jgi:Cohesin domain/RTX calcium-binding nonapeptide repeat (4 copies)
MVTLSISNSLLGLPNTTIPVDLLVDDATDLLSANFTIKYDTNILDLVVNDSDGNSSSVTLGSLTSGWTEKVNIDETNGTISLGLFNTQPITSGSGSLAKISFQIKADAPADTKVVLDIETAKLGSLTGGDISGGINLSDGAIIVTSNDTNKQISLDVDGDGLATSSRDGLLVNAFLFFNKLNPNRSDYSVLNKFIIRDPNATQSPTRTTGGDIANYLKGGLNSLDVDGDGLATSSRDGLLVNAFLFFNKLNPNRSDYSVLNKFIIRDPNATQSPTRPTGNDVANYLKGLLPVATSSGLAADSQDIAAASNIVGTNGNDDLVGNASNNSLFGDAGDDLLTGGLGADTFKFAANSGNDTINDFSIGEDLISIDSALGFSNGSEVFAAVTSKGAIDGQFSSELNLGANGTVTILHDRALIADNFAVI